METVKIGIIGAGRIGKLHAENLVRIPQVEIRAISDIFPDQIQSWAESFGIPKVIKDYQDILNDPEIDAVFICSPTHTHVSVITEAAKAGKHIFCEKPISFDLEQTLQALQVVQECGVKFQTGFNRRFDHNFKQVREIVEAGKIGEPYVIKITSRDPETPPSEYIKVSGGMFIDMSIHDFDIARFLSGSDVEEVYAQGAVLVDPVFAEYGDVDTAIISLKFKNGALGIIDNSRKAVYGYDQRVEVFGSKGCVNIKNDLPSTAEVSTVDGVIADKPKYFFLERYREAYVEETKAFIDSVLYGKDVPVDGNDGLQAELIAHAAKKSLVEGRPVKIAQVTPKEINLG
ncbi:inositol 2-dehydrogenase [Aneurinibacillus terranovensis]|uniref:inositol 2-dehydrogenase n=1 Tax=Aneurinibacillus terranovensis TaxID=278991 RepID=UPI00041EAD6B|nr:inositol 2-dehydrogenase [Aneurinibacillus terranovensis]